MSATGSSPPTIFALGQRLRGIFNPRTTDFQRLLKKLEDQFHTLDVAHERYNYSIMGMMDVEEDDGSPTWDGYLRSTRAETTPSSSSSEGRDKKEYDNPREDPNHPINDAKFNSNLIADVHFVGRSATDPSIVKLSTLLINHDNFGCIIEIWLNDNQISDEGSSAIASYLELPSCPLIELWLGRNQIGPSGAVTIAVALDKNNNSKLKCLGLYLNPIGNEGASTLAHMLRKNHTLTTVDVHGCLYYDKKKKNPKNLDDGPGITELYGGGCGCKVITPYDGNEYLAQVIDSGKVRGAGFVTDGRFTDAISTFSAFNRMNPTREKAIRGGFAMPSGENKEAVVVSSTSSDAENEEEQSDDTMSNFLSELGQKPGKEHLTDAEKCRWKELEWQRL